MSSEDFKGLFNGNAPIYLKIASLAFQGMVVAGVFWVGATFERKADFEAYKKEQEIHRMEDLKAEYERSNMLSRLEERLRGIQESQQQKK